MFLRVIMYGNGPGDGSMMLQPLSVTPTLTDHRLRAPEHDNHRQGKEEWDQSGVSGASRGRQMGRRGTTRSAAGRSRKLRRILVLSCLSLVDGAAAIFDKPRGCVRPGGAHGMLIRDVVNV